MTPDARFLYVAANGGSSGEVIGFAIGADGVLTQAPGSPFETKGQNASGVAITPAGDRLVVSNRGTGLNNAADPGSLAVFDIDRSTGALTMVPNSPFAITGLSGTDLGRDHP